MKTFSKYFNTYIVLSFILCLFNINASIAKELLCEWSSGNIHKQFIKDVPAKKTFYTNQFKKGFFGGKSMVGSMSCPRINYSLKSEKKIVAHYDWTCALYDFPNKSATLVYSCSEKKYNTITASKLKKNKHKRILSSSSYGVYSDTSICFHATTTLNGIKVWNNNETYVSEAKNRGLDCGVKKDNLIISKISGQTRNKQSIENKETDDFSLNKLYWCGDHFPTWYDRKCKKQNSLNINEFVSKINSNNFLKQRFCYLMSGPITDQTLPYFKLKSKFRINCNNVNISNFSQLPHCPKNYYAFRGKCYGLVGTRNFKKVGSSDLTYFYEGEILDGEFHGQGFYVNMTSDVQEGIWKKGKFIYKEKILENKSKTIASTPSISKSPLSTELIKEREKRRLEESKRKELERRLAALEKKQQEQQSKPTPVVATNPKPEFPLKPIPINFPSVSVKRDDIAVIIGNANYKKQGKDIPNVNPAYADAEGIKQYFMKAKGVREGNIIFLKDATNAQILSVFGNEKSHKGKLFNYIKPNKSNVYIYYAGHGAPGKEGDAYLVPTDTDSQTIEFTGYPLSTLYSNLGKLPAKSMTVILEACFSGGSQSGSLISRASPIVIQPKKTFIPNNIKVIAAGSERQMASWEEDSSHSLFTKYFLKAMSGEGDINKDGKVSDTELKEYLSDTMTYFARRYYGRDQKVQIHNGG